MTVSALRLQTASNIASLHNFYPAEINVPHHQLRNFISTVDENRIYYVNNYDIFLLDLETNQRTLLATVPFEARCLAAAHGWICVGGEMKGDCAFVRVVEEETKPGTFGHEIIVDMLGKEIVNSMTVHRIHSANPDIPDEDVVLISNNDKSVTVYSLSQQDVLAVLEHPVPMNYATLSANGTIMAAVGDSNEVYFYLRNDLEPTSGADSDGNMYPEYDWRLMGVPPIPMGADEFDDFSFAITFSPSGHLCAVSSQGGAITIFDMLAVADDDIPMQESILCTFRSSRASVFGCVRSMAFSPDPWELLAWAEDHGRIGIADVRQGFIRRQHLELNKSQAQNIEIDDITPTEVRELGVKERLKHQHLQRMRALRGQPPIGARSLDAARRQQTRRELLYSHHGLDLDAREQSVLEALETTIDDVQEHNSRPFSINYNSSPQVRASASASDSRRDFNIQLLNPSVRLSSSNGPRRRSSVVLSNPTTQRLVVNDDTRTMMTASPGPMTEDASIPPMSTNDLTPSAGSSSSQPLPYNIPSSDPWHVIEASLAVNRRERPVVATSNRHPAILAQLEAAIFAEQQIGHRLQRQLADERRLATTLRSEIETRENLLENSQQELQSIEADNSAHSPSLERVLQRQLESEQESGQHRSEELQNEIRITDHRVDRLFTERESLMQWLTEGRDGTPQTSARPPSGHRQDSPHFERLVTQLDAQRRVRRHRIQDLESQARRAESRVELASLQTNIGRLEAAEREEHIAAAIHPERPTEMPLAESANTLPSVPNNRTGGTAIRPVESGANGSRSTIPRSSELAGRATENDIRLARMMLQRAAMDNNGNWNAAGFQRLFGTGGTTRLVWTANRNTAIEEIMRDGGVGTAGIGWSPDGSYLYAGSEQGIFEFKVNLRDRMQFPLVEMR